MGSIVNEDEIHVGIKQLGNISDDFAASVIEFDKKVAAFFEKLNAEIGSDDTHETWYGARAEKFMKDHINSRYPEFEKAIGTLKSYANTLGSHAEDWNHFEHSSI